MRVRSRRQEPVAHAKTDSESALTFLFGLGMHFRYKSPNIPQLTCFDLPHGVVSDHAKLIPLHETKPEDVHLFNANINLVQCAPTTNWHADQGTRLELV